MTHPIAILRHEEPVRFDSDRLEALCAEHGDDTAEEIIARALEQIAIKLAALEALYQAGDREEMDKLCNSLTRVARQIGMTTLARVARDVQACLRLDNPVNLAAVLHRLMRIGDSSVHAIWSVEDVSV